MSGFNQLCVWPGTVMGENTAEDFEDFFKDMGFTVKFMEEVATLPDYDSEGKFVEGTGGRHDVFFYIEDKDIIKFAIPRLRMGIRWWEDVLGNHNEHIYPKEIVEKYPNTWKG